MSAKAMLDAIWTRLAASTVYTTVGGRIGLAELPADTALPLVVYDFDAPPSASKMFGNVERFEGTVVFRIYQSSAAGKPPPTRTFCTISEFVVHAVCTHRVPGWLLSKK